jgi:hypothetical protein
LLPAANVVDVDCGSHGFREHSLTAIYIGRKFGCTSYPLRANGGGERIRARAWGGFLWRNTGNMDIKIAIVSRGASRELTSRGKRP